MALGVAAVGLAGAAVAWCVRVQPATVVAGGSWIVLAGTLPLAAVLARVAARMPPGERADVVLELALVVWVAVAAALLPLPAATGSIVAAAATAAAILAVIGTFVALASRRLRRRVTFRSLAVDLVDTHLVGALAAAVVLLAFPLPAGTFEDVPAVLLAWNGYATFGIAYGHHLLARLTGDEARRWDRTFVAAVTLVGVTLLLASRMRGTPTAAVWCVVGVVVVVVVLALTRLPRVLPTPVFPADRSEVDRPSWPHMAAALAVAAIALRLAVEVRAGAGGATSASFDDLFGLCLDLVLLGALLALRARAQRAEVDGLAAFVAEELGRDELTGVLTRRAFLRRAPGTLRDAARLGASAAVVVFDLDELKATNDRGGHAAGDALLHDFAQALRRARRHQDLVARFGGDEFVALLLLAADDDPADAVHHYVHRTDVEVVRRRGRPIRASWGWAVVDEGTPLDLGLDVADQQMYAMKRLRRAGRSSGARPAD